MSTKGRTDYSFINPVLLMSYLGNTSLHVGSEQQFSCPNTGRVIYFIACNCKHVTLVGVSNFVISLAFHVGQRLCIALQFSIRLYGGSNNLTYLPL
jgi:hypothetical protein